MEYAASFLQEKNKVNHDDAILTVIDIAKRYIKNIKIVKDAPRPGDIKNTLLELKSAFEIPAKAIERIDQLTLELITASLFTFLVHGKDNEELKIIRELGNQANINDFKLIHTACTLGKEKSQWWRRLDAVMKYLDWLTQFIDNKDRSKDGGGKYPPIVRTLGSPEFKLVQDAFIEFKDAGDKPTGTMGGTFDKFVTAISYYAISRGLEDPNCVKQCISKLKKTETELNQLYCEKAEIEKSISKIKKNAKMNDKIRSIFSLLAKCEENIFQHEELLNEDRVLTGAVFHGPRYLYKESK